MTGTGFGHPTEVSGEVVFNTGMVGYPESLTDPSYFGQILVPTWPLVGTYGVPSISIADNFGIPLHFESDRIQVTGYCISELQASPSHWSSEKTLDEWFREKKVPGICGIDTRELTKRLRISGTMLGILQVAEDIDIERLKAKAKSIQDPNASDLVKSVSVDKPIEYGPGNSPKVALIDCGVKFGILRNLLARNASVMRVPYDFSAKEILRHDPSGVVISNGPGDPKICAKTINAVKELLETGIPVMGICLGSQILGLAVGGDTFKLKFGHRAQNHPCVDLETKRAYITTQNHGYTVAPKSLDKTNFTVNFINANDKTVEGIKHKGKPVFGVQFHPEASPGPYETGFLFDKFLKEVIEFPGM